MFEFSFELIVDVLELVHDRRSVNLRFRELGEHEGDVVLESRFYFGRRDIFHPEAKEDIEDFKLTTIDLVVDLIFLEERLLEMEDFYKDV